MRIRGAAISAVIALEIVSASFACGSSEDASAFGEPRDSDASVGPLPPSGGADAGGASVGAASGVVILHAAAFPAFRLCFANYPELLPQPDRTVMPRANVVGVEVGSVVRIAALERAPGKVFVVSQRKVPASPDDTKAKSCGQLFQDGDLELNLEYHEAGSIDVPLGVDRVAVLAITGCGGGPYIDALDVLASDCGADWNSTSGSLRARTLTLLPTTAATARSLPVQVVHMSSFLDAKRNAGEQIDVSFGPLDGGTGRLEQKVASQPPLFDASAPVTLTLDQTSEATYGTHGFRIAVRPTAGGLDASSSFSVDQTLAEIQDLSFPQTVPTTYYLTASNYALLLLGDPRVTRTIDGGPNPDYARRSVHLLAVPVKEGNDEAPGAGVGDAAATDSGK